MKSPATAIAAACCCLMLASCSGTTVKEAPKQVEKPEPITGRHAFQQIFPMARGWATDALPVLVQNINLTQVKACCGKSGAWEVTFYSATSGKTKRYTWSAVEAEGNLHQGVFAGQEEGSRGQKPFEPVAIQKD